MRDPQNLRRECFKMFGEVEKELATSKTFFVQVRYEKCLRSEGSSILEGFRAYSTKAVAALRIIKGIASEK